MPKIAHCALFNIVQFNCPSYKARNSAFLQFRKVAESTGVCWIKQARLWICHTWVCRKGTGKQRDRWMVGRMDAGNARGMNACASGHVSARIPTPAGSRAKILCSSASKRRLAGNGSCTNMKRAKGKAFRPEKTQEKRPV